MLPAWAARIGFAAMFAILVSFSFVLVFVDDLGLQILGAFTFLGTVAILCLVLGIDALLAIRRHRKWQRLAALGVLLFSFAPWSYGDRGARMLAAVIRVRVHEAEYLELVREALADVEPKPGTPYAFTDERFPKCAAVVWSGLTDNWIGVVYDPTQTFESADEKAFGGRMLTNTHLYGPWYYVSFT